MTHGDAPLDGLWYLAALSRDLPRGAMRRRVLFGDPLLLGRTKSGDPFALRDVCPHRGAPLSAGRLVDAEQPVVECPYHGWTFRTDTGICVRAPAISETARVDIGAIRVGTFHLHEEHGVIWIYHGAGAPQTAAPDLGLAPTARPRLVTIVESEGPFDEAVLGLVDPAHTPVVHKQWWWRDGAPRKEKEKVFEPTALGFRMPPHPPSSNSRIYKFLGGAPTTEIEFRLPGVRLERVRSGRRELLGLTAMTPGEKSRTRIVHVIYWTIPFLGPLTPVLGAMAHSFLGQDGAVLTLQNTNLSRLAHRPLYVGDPDEPSKWYFQLKRAWAARAGTGGFINPVEPALLRWRT